MMLPPPCSIIDGSALRIVWKAPCTLMRNSSSQWRGSFGHPGNGLSREELRQALAASARSRAAHQLARERALLRLDGHYGTGAVLADLAG